jgi:hypothetical protein
MALVLAVSASTCKLGELVNPRAAGTVVSPAVGTYVALWAALGGSVNVGSGSPSARVARWASPC